VSNIGVIEGVRRTSLLLRPWDFVLSKVAIKDTREFDDDMPNKLQQTIDKASAWLVQQQGLQIPITPKMHFVESHLAEYFKEWVDILHQVGIKQDNKRSSGLRD
jgi:hypothetical protein